MPSIDRLNLRCRDPQSQRRFYCDVLGMHELQDGSVSYTALQSKLCFIPAQGNYSSNPDDLYWKIALSVPNIELAFQQLTAKNIEVTTPKQFQDVGYLAHFTDPEGFKIELIEHWFQGNRPDKPDNTELLGGGPGFNLITLRTSDIDSARDFCIASGMTALSIQPVENYGFTLYFYAFTNDTPPSSNLTAIENREWLYQRPYTILELQHFEDRTAIKMPEPKQAGYAGTELSDLPHKIRHNTLLISTNPQPAA